MAGHTFHPHGAVTMPDLPLCCYADTDDEPAIHLYAVYNRGGDPETAGLNYAGKECPAWDDLPDNVKAKWRAAADAAALLGYTG